MSMAGGLRFDSLADMPEGMRKLAAEKIVAGTMKTVQAVGAESASSTDPSTTLRCAQDDKRAKKPNKYRNVETVVDGVKFQSKKEARRFVYLKRAQELGVIEDLRLQVDFTLQEGFKKIDGQRVQAIRYVADFTYKVKSAGYDHALQLDMADIEYWRGLYPGALVIEDTKSRGTRTKEYKIKRKLMADKGYEVREV